MGDRHGGKEDSVQSVNMKELLQGLQDTLIHDMENFVKE